MAMSSTNNAILKLTFLVIPFAILTGVLHDGQSGGVGGGGSYDLSGLVYGMLMFAFIVVWLIWMLISYSMSSTPEKRKMHLMLLLVGLAALIAAWFVTPRMF